MLCGLTLWVNLFIGNTTNVAIDDAEVTLHQETNYPWDGVVEFTVSSSQPVDKNLKIRIPDWCKNYTLAVNGENTNHNIEKGYAVISNWKSGDVITLNMDMPVEKVSADPRVKQDVGKRAIQRGPLVYCLEEVDNQKDFSQLKINKDTRFEVVDKPELLDGVKMIEATTGEQHMYLIPYYAWDNRQAGKMKVWIDYQE